MHVFCFEETVELKWSQKLLTAIISTYSVSKPKTEIHSCQALQFSIKIAAIISQNNDSFEILNLFFSRNDN